MSTPFTTVPEAGLLRSSGIWLGEGGSAGGLHQIDLAG